jgi:chemosensory pili system protein ChpA (sensor histidine kinase/response regulator)
LQKKHKHKETHMMETNFNLGSLKIVYNPLMEYFKAIQKNVSDNLVLMRDEKKIASNFEALEILNKVQGTLKMIGLVGLVKVLSLSREALKEVKEIKYESSKSIQILEICDSLFSDISIYIQNLLNGEMDQPTKFYSEYSKLANLIGKEVSIKDLFVPRLDFKVEATQSLQNELRSGLFINNNNKVQLLSIIQKAKDKVSESLKEINVYLDNNANFKSIDDKNHYHSICKQLFEAVDSVQKIKLSKTVFILLGLQKLLICVSSPIFNDQFVSLAQNDGNNLKNALAKIESSLTALHETISEMEEGEKTGQIKADDEAVRETLYLLIHVLKANRHLGEMPIFVELGKYFDIEAYAHQLTDIGIVASVAQRNPEVAAQIDKTMIELKEETTLLTSKPAPGKSHNHDEFVIQHITKLNSLVYRLNETLVASDKHELESLLKSIFNIGNRIKNGDLAFTEALQKELSLAIVLIEYGVHNFVKSIVNEKEVDNFQKQSELQIQRLELACNEEEDKLKALALPVLDERSRKNDERKAFLKIFAVLSKELKKAEEILDQYFRSHGENAEEMDEVFNPLSSAKGIFAVIGQQKLSEIVNDITNIWKQVVAHGLDSVDKEHLNQSVSWLSGISLFVAASESDNELEANELADNIVKKYNSYMGHDHHEHKEQVVLLPQIEEQLTPIRIPVEEMVMDKEEIVQEKPATHEPVAEVESVAQYTDVANDADLLEVYLLEAQEVLENMTGSLARLSLENLDIEELTNVRRYFHTLKGSGRMVGLNNLGEAAWMAEQTLNRSLSNDLEFSPELLSLIKNLKNQFDGWVHEMELNKSVSLDLVSLKHQFKTINDHLTTTIDIADVSKLAPVEPIPVIEEKELVAEVKSEFITIADKDVPLSLFALFNDESHNHLEALKAYLQENKGQEKVQLDHDFMLHAHTLASIARTVNLNSFATVASKIEVLSNVAIEKTVLLTEHQLNILGYVIFNLETLKNVDEQQANEPLFTEMLARLDEVQAEVTAEVRHQEHHSVSPVEMLPVVEEKEVETTEEHPVESQAKEQTAPVAYETFDKEAFKEEILSAVENQVKGLGESIHEAIENLAHEISEVKDHNHEQEAIDIHAIEQSVQRAVLDQLSSEKEEHTPVFNAEEVEGSILNKLREEMKAELNEHKAQPVEVAQPQVNTEEIVSQMQNLFSEKFNALTEAFERQENAYKNVISELEQKVESLSKDLNILSENQMNSDSNQKKELEGFRKEIHGLAYLLKKKSNGDLDELFSQEGLTEEEIAEISQELMRAYEESLETVKELSRHGVPDEMVINHQHPTIELFIEKPQVLKVEETISKTVVSEPVFNEVPQINHEIIETVVIAKEHTPAIKQDNYVVYNDEKISNLIENNDFIKAIFEEKVSAIEDDIDPELYEISKIEADEMLEKINEIVESIQEDRFDNDQNNELKRYLHTFKGSVRMAGANKLGGLAHRLESLLDYSENRQISLYHIKSLLEKEMEKINFLINHQGALSLEKNLWLDSLVEVRSTATVHTEITHENSTDKVQPVQETVVVKKEEQQYIRVLSNLVDSLINEAGQIRLTRTTLEGMLDGNRRSLLELKSSSYKLSRMLKEIEIQAESQIQAGKDKQDSDHNFDPLEFDRFTRLQELTRFMNEAVADVQDTVVSMDGYFKTQENAVVQQSILTNNILDSLMKVRLVPVDSISPRLYSIIRKTSSEVGKKVVLKLIGERTEMDRLVLDKVIAPIDHLLRNCIAHGIENPEQRELAGKSVTGTITMETALEGNFIVMKIADDGAGMNLKKIRETGIKKGLINENQSYDKDHLIDLIFHSGFSTADNISTTAGRGVGMDVVKNEITALGGSITVVSEQGHGTLFTIILPVAVATNQAMLTDVMGKLVAIPALLVNKVFSLKHDTMQQAYHNGFVSIRGDNKQYPLYYLGHMLGLLPLSKSPEIKNNNRLILVSYMDQDIVVHVDRLHTTNEILIKSLGSYFNKINGLLGATLLGDGRQGIVINPIMLRTHFEKNVRPSTISTGDVETVENKMNDVITVMVVDDSITVRRATSKILERYSYNIITAKDGEDALEQLQLITPDIILSDIEMPRMDGFEFARNVRNTEKYSTIPIIMITSRTADKHRNYAFSLGVNDFLGKPYQEDELIEKIRMLTGEKGN